MHNMPPLITTKPMTRFIDLFCGIGGFRVALESLGGQCVFSSEIDSHACEAYYKNFGDNPAGDITLIPEADIPEHDVLCAGFPCQSFSGAGNRKGFRDPRGQLFFEIIRIAKFHKPAVLLLENVRQITTIDNGKIFAKIKTMLNKIGYNLHNSILYASKFGIPQSRLRWYGVAIRKDSSITYSLPPLSHKQVSVANIIDAKYDYLAEGIKNRLVITHPQNYKPTERNRILRVGHIERLTKPDSPKKSQGYCVYSMHGCAITIPAQCADSRKAGIYLISKNTCRPLHNNEIKAVMGFPPEHYISKGAQGRKQLGNAVIPEMIRVIAKGLRGL